MMNNNKFYAPIKEFTFLLLRNKIPFSFAPLYDGGQWTFPAYPNGDVAIHSGTYHSDEGYLESYGMPWDEGDVSVETPEEMALRVQFGIFSKYILGTEEEGE